MIVRGSALLPVLSAMQLMLCLMYMPAGDIKPGEQSPAGIYIRQSIQHSFWTR